MQTKNKLMQAKAQIADKTLAQLVEQGVAYHHAGSQPKDRKIVEELFLGGHLAVICTTSTLAVGVNLPAHLVIIKSTFQYMNGQIVRYSNYQLKNAWKPSF